MSTNDLEFEGDEFSNNLFSDLAPLLALFGERVATQYLRHSTKHIENLIFACGPLGILTAMTAAIRVGGDRRLKAMIGRAEEPNAAAEIELVSSTSTDICELWNGVGIVRVVGQPDILEVVIQECHDANDKGHNIKLYTRHRGLHILREAELDAESEDDIARIIPPNISLNTIGRSIGDWELRAVAVVGVLLQLGVLAWDAVVTYHLRWSKGNQKVPPYAFPMTVIGTLGLVCGMYLCAYIIEVSTKELKWQPGNDNAESDDKSPSSRIIWIQRHQTVGDQNFGSFAIYAPGSGKDTNLDLMTSHRSVNNKRKLHTLTLFAITSSIVAFILQFVGLRAMHYSSSIAQLAATIAITILRVTIRRHISQAPQNLSDPEHTNRQPSRESPRAASSITNFRDQYSNSTSPMMADNRPSSTLEPDHNLVVNEHTINCNASELAGGRSLLRKLPSDGKFAVQALKKGFELEMMAMQIEKCLFWEVRTSDRILALKPHGSPVTRESGPTSGGDSEYENSPQEALLGHRVVDTRILLGNLLNTPWPNELSHHARVLSNTISDITNFLWKSASGGSSLLTLMPQAKNLDHISWKIPVLVQGLESTCTCTNTLSRAHGEPQYITLSLKRHNHGAQKWSPWEADYSSIEALLQLWMSQVLPSRTQAPLDSKSEVLWLLCAAGDSESSLIADWWIGPTRNGEIIKHRSLKEICAQRDIVSGDSPDFRRIISYVPIVSREKHQNINTPHSNDLLTLSHFINNLPVDDEPIIRAFVQNISIPSLGIQYILYTFLCQIAYYISDVTAETVVQGMKGQGTVLLRNETLVEIATRAEITGLVQFEDAYRMVIYAMHAVGKLPKDKGSLESFPELLREVLRVVRSDGDAAVTDRDAILQREKLRILYCEVQDALQARVYNLLKKGLVAEAYEISMECVRVWESSVGKESEYIPKLKDTMHSVLSHLDVPFNKSLNSDTRTTSPSGPGGQGVGPTDWQKVLISATEQGQAPDVHWCVRQGASIEQPDPLTGLLPLDLAICAGNKDIIHLLLLLGAVMRDSIIWWVISWYGAAKMTEDNCMKMILFLIGLGADVNKPKDGEFPLHRAVKLNLKNVVVVLLREGSVSVNMPDPEGFLALHYASKAGDEELIQLLLDNGAEVYEPNIQDQNRNAVHYAAREGFHRALKLLTSNRGSTDINQRDSEGYAALDHGVQRNHDETILTIMECGGDINGKNPKTGRTALHLAAEAGKSRIVQTLMKSKSVDKEVHDTNGDTPLHLASMNIHTQTVYILLVNGANPETRNNRCRTPLELAKDSYANISSSLPDSSTFGQNHEDLIWLLENSNSVALTAKKETMIHAAARGKSEKTIQRLVRIINTTSAHGSENGIAKDLIDTGDESQLTPLHLAVQNQDEAIVRMLLDAGASVDKQTWRGTTPLHLAIQSKHEAIVCMLLGAGALPDAKNYEGWAPLTMALSAGHKAIVRMLLDAGATVDIETQNGRAPLHLAVQNQDEDIVRMLLAVGASVDIQTWGGTTPLHFAIQSKHEAIVRMLLDAGALPDAKDNEGSTPLTTACALSAGHLQAIVRMLLDAGASVDTENRHGITPLHFAIKNQHEGIVRMLLHEGAPPDVQDHAGQAPLHIASNTGNEAIVRLVLNAGGSVHMHIREKKNGWAPWHFVARTGNIPIAQMFVDCGADINITASGSGATALHIATKAQRPQLIQWLLAQGASIGIKDNEGQTALYYADKPFPNYTLDPLVGKVYEDFRRVGL